MAITVELPAFEPIGRLVGETDASVAADGKLKGRYRFDLMGQRSDPSNDLGTAASPVVVERIEGDRYRLKLAELPTSFVFPVGFAAGVAGGPRLGAKRALILRPSRAAEAIIVLKQVSLSLLDGPVPDDGKFTCPSSETGQVTGSVIVDLILPGRPEGCPLERVANGYAIRIGNRQTNSAIGHDTAARIGIATQAGVSFLMADLTATPRGRVELTGGTANTTTVRLALHADSGLRVAAPATSARRAPIQDGAILKLSIERDLLTIDRFHGDTVQAQYSAPGGAARAAGKESLEGEAVDPLADRDNDAAAGRAVTPAIEIRGFADQFRFFQKLPRANTPMADAGSQLLFDDTPTADYRRRFHGLSITGLASTRTEREWLDCSHATATRDAEKRFQLKAGGPLKLTTGSKVESWLLPKPMPRPAATGRADESRRIEIPVGSLRLTVDADVGGAFTLDTAKDEFALVGAGLEGRPTALAGEPNPTAARAAGGEAYKPWRLRRADPMPFGFLGGTMVPKEAQGAWARKFDYETQPFRLLEHPGAGFTMVNEGARPAGDRDSSVKITKTELTEYKPNDDIDKLATMAISALCATLSYVLFRRAVGDWDWSFLDVRDVKVRVQMLKGDQLMPFVKGLTPNDIRVVFDSSTSKDDLHGFIEANVKEKGGKRPEDFYLPMANALSVVLYKGPGGQKKYCDELVPGSDGSTIIAIDCSETSPLPERELFGGKTFADMAKSDIDLWPAAGSGAGGQRKDPSSKNWTGLFFRNMPLNIVLENAQAKKALQDNFPTAARALDVFNEGCRLDYGWYDNTGPTWRGELKPSQPIELLPAPVNKFVSLTVNKGLTKGYAGKNTTGFVSLTFGLPIFADKDAPPEKIPSLNGEVAVDFDNKDNPFLRVALRTNQGEIATSRIPGFDKVKVAGVSSDWKSAQLDLEFFPSPRLRSIFKIFDPPEKEPSKQEPFKAAISFDFKGGLGKSVAIVVPYEIKTTLLGKWPVTIQSIRLDLTDPDKPDTQLEFSFLCQVALGIPGIDSIACKVVLSKTGSGWDYDVIPQGIEGKLSFGDVKLKGKVEWRDRSGKKATEEVKKDDREFWGELELEGGVFQSGYAMAVRIGAASGRPFWIAGLKAPKLDIGSVTIEKPVLLVAHGADAGLRDIVTNPAKSLDPIRPKGVDDKRKKKGEPDDPESKKQDEESKKQHEAWLSAWSPSAKMGTVVAASGYLKFDNTVGVSTNPGEGNHPEDGGTSGHLTNVILTDSGQVRIDAWLKLFGSDGGLTRLVLGIDFDRGRVMAGAQLPQIAIPSAQNPRYVVYPGFFYVSFTYKGRFEFKLSVGWPEKKEGAGIERDWSKATKVYIPEMWPINTVWGGWLFDYAGDRVTFGIAIRAGWTWSYPGSGSKIAWAEAEVGIALGGVFIFDFGKLSEATARLPVLPARFAHDLVVAERKRLGRNREARVDLDARAAVQPFLEALDEALGERRFDIGFTAEIYGDIWGRGSAGLMGVTLASISVAAYARFETRGSLNTGITSCRAITGYKVQVTILCVSYSAHVEIEVRVV